MIFNESGGNLLNLKVVGGTSAPSNPKENTIWVNTDWNIHTWDFCATEPHKKSCTRNLICYPFNETTVTKNGVKFTDNKNGAISVDGTATADTAFYCSSKGINANEMMLEPGTYTLGNDQDNLDGNFALILHYSYDNWVTTEPQITCSSRSVTFTLTKYARARVQIWVRSGTTTNRYVRPQLEKGSIANWHTKGTNYGQVWVKTSLDSPVEFNALKKNNISVYPAQVYQSNGALWASKVAKSYQGGKWVDWFDGYLYNAGKDATAITGGWKVEMVGRNDNTGDSYSGKIAENTSNITITGVGSKGCIYRPVNKIDLSGKKKLLFNGTLTPAASGGKYVLVGVWSAFGTKFEDNLVAYFDATSTKTGTQTIDISSLNGSYYIGVAIHGLDSKIIMNSLKIE